MTTVEQTMKYLAFGTTGLQVSQVALGLSLIHIDAADE